MKNAGMAVVTGEAGRTAADIIQAAQKRHVPVLTKRSAAAQAGISVDGWDKVIRTGRGRDTTFAAMARVVGAEAEVRIALGQPAVGDGPPLDDELDRIERQIGLDLSSLPADLRRALLRHYQALDARMSELERREAERQDRPAV
jgi:hypothetical protein